MRPLRRLPRTMLRAFSFIELSFAARGLMSARTSIVPGALLLPPSALLFQTAQLAAPNLARHCQRDLVDELDPARVLVRGERASDVGLDLLRERLRRPYALSEA